MRCTTFLMSLDMTQLILHIHCVVHMPATHVLAETIAWTHPHSLKGSEGNRNHSLGSQKQSSHLLLQQVTRNAQHCASLQQSLIIFICAIDHQLSKQHNPLQASWLHQNQKNLCQPVIDTVHFDAQSVHRQRWSSNILGSDHMSFSHWQNHVAC